MPFQKGNTLGAKGRPKGSKNKATDVQKFEIQNIFFNLEEMKRDFEMLSPDKKYDIRMKAMSFFFSRPAVELEVDATPWTKVEYITDIGEEQPTDEEIKEYETAKAFIEACKDLENKFNIKMFAGTIAQSTKGVIGADQAQGLGADALRFNHVRILNKRRHKKREKALSL